jgi:hypothetical protein
VLSVAVGCHKAYLHSEGEGCASCGGLFKKCGKCGKCSKCHVDNCSDIPAGAIPLPVGAYTYTHFSRQNAKAEADDFVIYWNHFQENSTKLSPWGSQQMLLIAKRLPYAPYPVVIQVEKNPELGRARREEVVTFLRNAGIENAAERVILGWPGAEGLYGEEAERIFQQLPLAGSGSGGFGGFGFGGGFIGGYGGGYGR